VRDQFRVNEACIYSMYIDYYKPIAILDFNSCMEASRTSETTGSSHTISIGNSCKSAAKSQMLQSRRHCSKRPRSLRDLEFDCGILTPITVFTWTQATVTVPYLATAFGLPNTAND